LREVQAELQPVEEDPATVEETPSDPALGSFFPEEQEATPEARLSLAESPDRGSSTPGKGRIEPS